MTIQNQISALSELLLRAGATDIIMVGGCVRDRLLGIPSKDYDIEVYGLSYHQMIDALKGHFRTNQVGQSFNVLKIGNEIDLTIPRRESKQGLGHKGFNVEADPNMTFKEAAGRRDFTINAIGMRADGSFCDPYHGIEDLKRKILRAPTEAFCDDPLRVLRGMQFASRFGFEMEPRTMEFCRKVLPEFSTLSAERLFIEWKKWADKGRFPSKGLLVLRQTGWLSCFKELAQLEQIPQYASDSGFSDSGSSDTGFSDSGLNTYDATMTVCDRAAQIADFLSLNEQDRTLLLFAALCHDFGKPAVAELNGQGKWITPLHALHSSPAAEQFFLKMKSPLWIPEAVTSLCRYHSIYRSLKGNFEMISDRMLRKMAQRLEPANVIVWTCLEAAIYYARIKDFSPELWNRSPFRYWLEKAEELHISKQKQDPLLLGRDLISLGIKPGPHMKLILQKVYCAQMNGDIKTKEEAIEWFQKTMGNVF